MKKYRLMRAVKIVLFAAAAVAVGSFVVMSLWNVLMPGIFAVRAISFWQALGLLALSKILFGGFRPQLGGGPRWRHRMQDRLQQMSPEDREKFKQGMRCGFGRNVDPAKREAQVRA